MLVPVHAADDLHVAVVGRVVVVAAGGAPLAVLLDQLRQVRRLLGLLDERVTQQLLGRRSLLSGARASSVHSACIIMVQCDVTLSLQVGQSHIFIMAHTCQIHAHCLCPFSTPQKYFG